MRNIPRCIALIGLLPILTSHGAALQSSENVTLVISGELGEPGNFAADELATKLRARGAVVNRTTDFADTGPGPILIIGIPGRAVRLQDLVYSGRISLPPNPESYTIRRLVVEGKPVTVVAGSDERGLMYALLEIARRVGHSPADSSRPASILASLPESTEKPAVEVRGMIQFLHNADLEKDWYYDPEYWRAYLGMLAENRFNSFNLVFAHQTSYLAPPYPFLFPVERYPQVKVPGLSEAEQKKNLETLQAISRMCRERGIAFIMGIWEHRAWTRAQTSSVTGLTDEILVDYARLAMEKLLRLCPDISGIQLRVNTESGIANDQQTKFYKDGVIAGIQSAGRPVLLDLRGWGALPGTIDAVVNSGLPIRLSMKYWAEFMGMPYQAAQMLPSYSFADFLHYPRSYPVLYQLWSLGSHRLLPWGGVDWMKRFIPTTTLSDGLGFETCAPLSQKGFGNAPGNWRIFVSPQQEYYRWEFQRYWLYYLLFGRLGYNPSAAGDPWIDEFRARFGEKAALPMFETYQAASQVIPFLVSYRSSNPNMYIWPEKQTGGLLDLYIEVKPADEARFAGFDEYVARRLRGARSAKMTPEEASDRLSRMAEATERALSRAETALSGGNNPEFAANRIDFTVLALLARYHAQKIRAGAHLSLFYATGDETALRTAKSHAAAGLEIWQRLARLTDGIYHPKMVFGPRDVGHWKDNLVFVRHDTERLREVQEIFDRYGLFELGLDFGPGFLPRLAVYEPQYGSSYSVERRFRLLNPEMTYTTQRGYGWRQVFPIKASAPMNIPYSSLEGDNLEDLSLPSAVLYKDFLRGEGSATLLVDLPDGDYRVTSIVANQPELAQGSFRIRATGQNSELSYAVAETGDKSMNVHVAGNRLELEFVPDARDWLVSGLVIARRAPHIAHIPKASALPGLSLRLEATITAPDGVSSATLHYWPEGANQPVAVPMLAEGKQFTAELTADRKWEGKTVSYFISARDAQNHEARAPGRGEFTVRIGSDNEAPVLEHKPVVICEPGKDLGLSFGIRDASNLETARLHYRHMTQTEKFQTVDLIKTGALYEAMIPGSYIGTRYDLMYYVEAVDVFGNGAFYPNSDLTSPYGVVRVRR